MLKMIREGAIVLAVITTVALCDARFSGEAVALSNAMSSLRITVW